MAKTVFDLTNSKKKLGGNLSFFLLLNKIRNKFCSGKLFRNVNWKFFADFRVFRHFRDFRRPCEGGAPKEKATNQSGIMDLGFRIVYYNMPCAQKNFKNNSNQLHFVRL